MSPAGLRRRRVVAGAAILAVWLALALYATAHHEYWRDEVRPLTLAAEAASPLEIYGLVKYDGHPILWFLLLHAGWLMTGSPLVLPAVSLMVAFAAVALWLLRAPFPLWFKALFALGVLPLYEYSVMARNYGISMLLLFAAAALYPQRDRRPLLLALVLAMLANCNAHSAVLAGLLMLVWIGDALTQAGGLPPGRRLQALLPAAAIVAAGGALCALFALPRRNTILTGVYSLRLRRLGYGLRNSLLRPDDTFRDLLPQVLPVLAAVLLLYLAILGLRAWPRLALAAFAAMLSLGLLFRLAYPGFLRHQGLLLVFLLTLYWMARDQTRQKPIPAAGRRWMLAGVYVSLLPMMLTGVMQGREKIVLDLAAPVSSSRDFGRFLRQSDLYRDAIIVPEPDIYTESLPYYADNPIYLPREHRFGKAVSWTTGADPHLSLGELLARARQVRESSGRPVLIALGHLDLDEAAERDKKGEYNKTFSWSPAETAELRATTDLVAEFTRASGDENYRIHALR